MWKICVSDDEKYLNVEKIFPTQQKDVGAIVKSPRFEVPTDIWTNYDVDERLLSEIREKGVVVYER